MGRERWQTIERIYQAVLERSPDERAQCLVEACSGDQALLDEVKSLLSEDQKAGAFLEGGAVNDLAQELAGRESPQSPPAPEPDYTGRRLSHYEVLEKIASGGMGVVYRGRDLRLGRTVAIKVLQISATADPARVARFAREARAASSLNHTNIVTIYDIGQVEGVHFIAMEFATGRTLKEIIPAGGLPIDEALDYAVQIADALARAHDAGIIHRDLKPANVLVDGHGRVKILDFGLAKLLEPSSADTGNPESRCVRTESGLILGTAAYMSPEQAEGKAVDARSDIFSFGALLFEILTGRRAFPGSSPASVIASVLREAPPSVTELRPETPACVARLIRLCLRKDRNQRLVHLDDARILLEEVRHGTHGTCIGEVQLGAHTTCAAPQPSVRAPSKYRWGIVTGLALAGIAVASFFMYLGNPTEEIRGNLKVVPLATLPGRVRSPALSPDGRHVAFSWNGDSEDNFEIYLRDVGEPGAMLRLTTDEAYDDYPAWSPDGTRIAFCRTSGQSLKGEVFLISMLGGAGLRVTHCDFPCVKWMPDGKALAVAQREGENGDYSIFLVSLSDGSRRRLFTPPPQDSWAPFLWFSFSPDGNFLAFRTRGQGDSVQWLRMENGRVSGEARPMVKGENVPRGAWMPDGRQFVFPSDRDGRWALWRTRTDDESGNPERVVGGDEAAMVSVSAGPPLRLAYTRNLLDTDIWSLQVDGEGKARGVPVLVTRRKSQEHSAQLSLDGRKIAYESDFGTSRSQVWVADADGSNPVRLTRQAVGAGTVRWSPDGQHLAYNQATNGNVDIWVVNADGSNPRRLTAEPSADSRATWSRDGRWIYFRSNRSGKERIWKVASQGGAAEQVTQLSAQEGFEGADGLLYFFRNKDTATSGKGLEGSLWSVSPNGGRERLVLSPVWTLAWALSKRGIYFLDFSDHRHPTDPVPLKLFDPVTRRIAQVALLEGQIPFEPALSSSDDGRIVTWTKLGEERSDLVLLENPQQ